MGGVSKATVDVLKQGITLPEGYSSIGIKFRYFIDAARQTECNVDSSQVEFAGVQQQFKLCSESNLSKKWQEAIISVSGASGPVMVMFTTTLKSGKVSSFFIDDVQLCSDDPKAPAGTLPCTAQVEQRSSAVAGAPDLMPSSKE